jgi:formylglycine-generating enzyme required for sulfatase activity
MGKTLRLPTENEYYAMRALLDKDLLDWQQGAVGNINMEHWFSPSPVDLFKTGEFYDLVGNVWQHCSTPIHPFHNFTIHPIYEDFSTPTFDDRHYIIKRGSFVSTGNEAPSGRQVKQICSRVREIRWGSPI